MFYEVGMLDQFVVANKCVEVGYYRRKEVALCPCKVARPL